MFDLKLLAKFFSHKSTLVRTSIDLELYQSTLFAISIAYELVVSTLAGITSRMIAFSFSIYFCISDLMKGALLPV